MEKIWEEVPTSVVELSTKQLTLNTHENICHSNLDLVSKFLEGKKVKI